MIGQNALQTKIKRQIDDGTFPRFIILCGMRGSGRKTIATQIARWLNAPLNNIGVGVDDVREMIDQAYKVVSPTVYLVADADSMSVNAKNAMLKVTEEPPNNAYFILTLEDVNHTLPTIKSRGSVYYMNAYTHDEIEEYVNTTHGMPKQELVDIVCGVCETPYEVDLLMSYDPTQFNAFVNKVVDNIAVVSGSNSFKIADSIALDDKSADKYDLILFWKSFMSMCIQRLQDAPFAYTEGVRVTSKYLQELRVNGINKKSTFDMWLLDIRKAWM